MRQVTIVYYKDKVKYVYKHRKAAELHCRNQEDTTYETIALEPCDCGLGEGKHCTGLCYIYEDGEQREAG